MTRRYWLLAAALPAAACAREDAARSANPPASSAAAVAPPALTGAGATFPYPVYARWISRYGAEVGPRVNYVSVGSGDGARMLAAGRADFAVTESPASDTVAAPVRYFPLVAGAVAVTYNLPTLAAPLRVSGPVLADLWLGRIARWDDRRLRAINPGVALPATPVTVVSRDEESGTTYVVSSYLAAVSRGWATSQGVGGRVRWPVGRRVRGTEGVSGTVKQTPGSIAFVELTYAQQNRLSVAAVRNAAGVFVLPSAASTSAAVDAVVGGEPTPADARLSIIDAPGARAYPIVTMSWLVTRAYVADSARRATLARFVRWVLDSGAIDARALNYAPVPAAVAAAARRRLDSLGVRPAP